MVTIINGLEIDDCPNCGGNNYRIFSSESVSCAKCGHDFTVVVLDDDTDADDSSLPPDTVLAVKGGRQL